MDETRHRIKKFYNYGYNYCSQTSSLLTSSVLNFFKKLLKKLLKKTINKVGAIPVSGEIQEWLQSLVVRLN